MTGCLTILPLPEITDAWPAAVCKQTRQGCWVTLLPKYGTDVYLSKTQSPSLVLKKHSGCYCWPLRNKNGSCLASLLIEWIYLILFNKFGLLVLHLSYRKVTSNIDVKDSRGTGLSRKSIPFFFLTREPVYSFKNVFFVLHIIRFFFHSLKKNSLAPRGHLSC